MQTSFAQTKSEIAPKLKPEYECEQIEGGV